MTARLSPASAAARLLAPAAKNAAHSVSSGATKRPRNVWSMLPQVAPELTEWAAFFAAGASKRAAAEAGLSRAVTPREADDLLRDADRFLGVIEQSLGLAPHLAQQGQLPGHVSSHVSGHVSGHLTSRAG